MTTSQEDPSDPAGSTFLVFAQRSEASGVGVSGASDLEPHLDWPALARHARRFFQTEIAEAEDGRASVDGQRRRVHGRPATQADHELADALERASRHAGGLSLLARRCAWVWEVECEGPHDAASLLISAVLASLHLGPIVSADRDEIFGVKTARRYLEEATAPDGSRSE